MHHPKAAVAVFDLADMADKAVQGLVDAGFEPDVISVVCTDEACRRHFPDLHTERPAGRRTPLTAVTGGAIGALLGGLGGLALVTAGGAALVGAGAVLLLAGTSTGTFVGAMTSRGLEGKVADHCDQALEVGQIVVAVTADDRLEEAERVMREVGARPVEIPQE